MSSLREPSTPPRRLVVSCLLMPSSTSPQPETRSDWIRGRRWLGSGRSTHRASAHQLKDPRNPRRISTLASTSSLRRSCRATCGTPATVTRVSPSAGAIGVVEAAARLRVTFTRQDETALAHQGSLQRTPAFVFALRLLPMRSASALLRAAEVPRPAAVALQASLRDFSPAPRCAAAAPG